LALEVVLAIFVLIEVMRLARLPPIGAWLDTRLAEFRDTRDESPALLSHMYLLLGVAFPIWVAAIETRWLIGLAGLAALGVGDAAASIIGMRFGTWHWHSGTRKSFQGTLAFIVCTTFFFMVLREPITWQTIWAITLSGLVEAFSSQMDNLFVPLIMLLCLM
jgi:dolichol kinase